MEWWSYEQRQRNVVPGMSCNPTDKPRRMTMDDYAALGIVPPAGFAGYRPGSVFSAGQHRYENGETQPVIIEGGKS
ncbi:hypothetical protein [Companilactobacillus sp.]|uniref:hypothetical protein n=1 Tax=Companilactobacillus sp. TaxID=2767905 RepID=UPI002633AFA7|nr:hypothetical protein [Companilactobacillus sp.]